MMRYWTAATAILATMVIAMAKKEHTRSLYARADALGDFEANKHRMVKKMRMKPRQEVQKTPKPELVYGLALPTAPPSPKSKSKSKGSKCPTSKLSKGKGKGKGTGTGKKSKAPKSKAPSKAGDACAEPTIAPGSPTSAPSKTVDATCELSTAVACETKAGQGCALYPSCFATTTTINTIRLRYIFRPCSESSNSQGSFATCSVTELSTTETVTIECIDRTEGFVFFRTGVSNGDTFSFDVPFADNTGEVSCQIVAGSTVQSVRFQTDGTLALHVGDTFGSLEVIECDMTACEQKVVLSYSATNDSTDAAVELSSFTVKTTGESKRSILNDVKTILKASGKSTKTSETVKLDLCVDSLSIKANVKGKVEGGTATCKAQQIVELVKDE